MIRMMNTKRKLRELTTVVGSVLTCFIILSCSFSDEYVDLQDDMAAETIATAPVNLSLTVKTRATGDTEDVDDTEKYIANEDSIKTDDYRIYFFKTPVSGSNYTYLCTFEPDKFAPTTSGNNGNVCYSVSGKLNADTIAYINDETSGNYTVVFIANWGNYPTNLEQGVTTIDDLCTGNISCGGEDFTAKFKWDKVTTTDSLKLKDLYFPFYGVKQFTGMTLTADQEVNLQDFDLVRAVAKVKVVNVTKTQTRATYYPEIYDVKIVHHNAEGYCAPFGVYKQDIVYSNGTDNGYMADSQGNYYFKELHLTREDTGDTNNKYGLNDADQSIVDTIPMCQTNDSTWIAYIPEYQNKTLTNTADSCYIKYKVKCYSGADDEATKNPGGEYTKYYSDYNIDYTTVDDYSDASDEDKEKYKKSTLSFSSYTNGKITDDDERYDIKRNKSYRFNVSLPKVFKLTLDSSKNPDDEDTDVEGWYVKRKSDD